jgi:5,10-methenyltetrahydrofolate synthetase
MNKSLNTYINENKKIQEKLFSEINFSNYNNIFIYLSSLEKGEVDTWNIIMNLSSNHIFVPKIVNNEIKVTKYDKNYSKNQFGIFECNHIIDINIDIAIIPMLSFNKDLHRIGYGGGYYDKFLKNNKCLKVGLCFGTMRDWKQDYHDIPMDIIITPYEIFTSM